MLCNGMSVMMKKWGSLILAAAVLAGMWFSADRVPTCMAEEAETVETAAESSPEAVPAVQKCLKKSMMREYPWYNEKADSLAPVDLPGETLNTYESRGTTERDYSAFATIMKGLVYTLLGILAAVVVAALLYWGRRMWDNWVGGASRLTEADENARRRTEALPEEIQDKDGDFAWLARQAYERGDFRLAVIYLFSLQLTKLDEYKRIHLLKGRTNRQYQKSLKRSLKRQFAEHYEAISINATEPQRELWEEYRRLGAAVEDAFAAVMFLFEETFYGERTPRRESVDEAFRQTDEMLAALMALEKRVKKEFAPWKAMPPVQASPIYLPGMDPRQVRCWWLLGAMLAGLLCLTGCGKETLNTDYGRISSYRGSNSVVGTKVFADLMKEQGAKVSVEQQIKKRKFERRDSVVWFVQSWDDISAEAYLWAEEWLRGGTPDKPRTLLVVYRGVDCVRVYFDRILPQVKDPEQRRLIEQWHVSPFSYSGYSWLYDEDEKIDRWVKMDEINFVTAQKKIEKLTGEAAWADIVRAPDAELWTLGKMQLHEDVAGQEKKGVSGEMRKLMKNAFQQTFSGEEDSPVQYDEGRDEFVVKTEDGEKGVTIKNPLSAGLTRIIPEDELKRNCRGLLFSEGGKPFLAQRDYRNSDGEVVGQWYAAANGSFLLNSMLVNHENRKLAYRMAEIVGGEDRRVVFLETSSHPYIYEGRDNDEGERIMPDGWEMFEIFPLNFILFHITALTIFYMFYLYPIFGRARRIFAPGGSRFGEHVKAVGRLLRRK